MKQNESQLIIYDSMYKADSVINNDKYKTVMCSVSGGSDSDLLVDICTKVDKSNKVRYVFFDTGIEYQATKEHLKYLEERYNIKIEVEKAIKPIPLSCKEHGQPFLSKQISEYISRLQKHKFNWEDDTYENLIKKYPRCSSALKWWCNEHERKTNGSESSFNINYRKYLKEFMLLNPPQFKISNKCCTYAKKNVAGKFKKENKVDLSIVGVRKAEGGVRATTYKTCFDKKEIGVDEYRPIFWYSNLDKQQYIEDNEIKNSRCYSEYGLKRTGCVGCPYGRDFENELEIVLKHEPKLYKGINNIFKDSYAYTRDYKEFVKEMNTKE